jgi:transcription initiation factor TFIIIB Brf1 subunit/transcription initiation factor TFIIB
MSGSVKKRTKRKTNTARIYNDEIFDLFGDMDIKNVRSQIVRSVEDQECEHETFFKEGDINICKTCGCEIDQLDFQPEWRYYGSTDNRVTKDPSRCHKSKEVQKGSIDKVFVDAKLGWLPQSTKKKTEQKYKAIVKGETVRGKGRKAIVAACLLYVFRDEGDIRTSDDIRNMFSLTKQEMSEGLTRYHTEFPKDRTQHANPKDFIRRIMQQTKVDFCHYKYILKIANVLDKVDPDLNRSSPHSVASAVVYLYICMTPEVRLKTGVTKTKFAKDVGLSDITITKLVKISAEILGLKEIIA